MHAEKHGDTFIDWTSHNQSEAQQLLANITTFDFIAVFPIIYQLSVTSIQNYIETAEQFT